MTSGKPAGCLGHTTRENQKKGRRYILSLSRKIQTIPSLRKFLVLLRYKLGVSLARSAKDRVI
jgi:hypothetical protein